MPEYPGLPAWNALLADQAAGFLVWFIAVALSCLYLVWARRRWPLEIRLIGMGVFLLALAYAGRGYLPLIAPLGLVAGLGYSWLSVARSGAVKLSKLPDWAWLALLALALRLPGLWLEALWFDESFTAAVARLDISELWRVVASDVHPPLWYFIEWVTIRILGDSESALRFPSLAAGVLAVLMVYRLALSLKLARRTALAAGVLAAVLPALIYYSNEARGYSLLVCAVLLMAITILENRPNWFIVVAFVTMYTHNLGYVYTGLLMLAGLIVHRQDWLLPCLFAGQAGLLWLPELLKQSTDIADGFWMQPLQLGEALRLIVDMTVYLKVPETFLLPVTGAIVGLTLLALYFSRRWLITKPGLIWLALAILPPLAVAAVSVGWHNVYLQRALLPSMTALCILWAKLLTESHPSDRRAALVILAPVLTIALVSYYNPQAGRVDIRALLPRGCQNAETVFTTTPAAQFMAAYYLDSPVLWTQANDLNQQLTPDAKNALNWRQAEFDDLSGTICLIDLENALNRADERAYVASILAQHPARTIKLAEKSTFTLKVHIIEL